VHFDHRRDQCIPPKKPSRGQSTCRKCSRGETTNIYCRGGEDGANIDICPGDEIRGAFRSDAHSVGDGDEDVIGLSMPPRHRIRLLEGCGREQ
jgi:hypothetical protein